MHWYVYVENFNARRIEVVDALDHCKIREELPRIIREVGKDKEQFAELLKRELMYWYWSKCEWEIILTSWPPDQSGKFQDMKIDVYDQICLNWDVFVDYVWEHRDEVKRDTSGSK